MSRLILLAFMFAPLCAQQASLRMEVKDPSGARISGARVQVATPAGAVVAELKTNAEGLAELESLATGTVVVRATMEGFEMIQRRIALTAGKNAAEFILPISTIRDSVMIRGEAVAAVAVVEVSDDELARNPSTDLVDALRDLPGVNVLRRGGTNFDPVVYALRETQVAMIVDATRTFAAGPARMDSELSHVEPGHIDSVRVVSGPYALTEGAGAFAAIVVTTPDVPRFDRFRIGARTSLGYGSNGAGRFGRTRLFGGDRSFGFSLRAAGNKGNDYRAGESGGAGELTIPGDYSNHQFGGKLRFNPSDSQELALGATYDEQTGVDYPGRILNAKHFLYRGFNGAYLLKEPTAKVSLIKANLYLNKKSHRMRNDEKPTAFDMPGRTPPFALRIDLPTEADTAGGGAFVQMEPAEGWTLKTGFDFYNLDQDAQRFVARQSNNFLIFADAVWPNVSINDQGFFAQATRRFNRGEVAAALPFDTVQANAGTPSDYFLANTGRDLDQSEFNTSFSLSGR